MYTSLGALSFDTLAIGKRTPHPASLPGPAGAWYMGTRGEQAVAADGRSVATRTWDVWAHPETQAWDRVLFMTWHTMSPFPTYAAAEWASRPYTIPADDAARRAPGMLGTGSYLKESIVWDGPVLLNNRILQTTGRKVALGGARTDTLVLVESVDAGIEPIIRDVSPLSEPLPEKDRAWEEMVLINLAGGGVHPWSEPSVAPTADPKPAVYFYGGQYHDATGAVLTADQVAAIFPPPPLDSISPVLIVDTAGTPNAIVTTYGGGPGTTAVLPTTGLVPIPLPLTAAETAALTASQGTGELPGGIPWPWLVAGGAALFLLARK